MLVSRVANHVSIIVISAEADLPHGGDDAKGGHPLILRRAGSA